MYIFAKNYLLNKINIIFYAIVGLITAYFAYQYSAYSVYIGGIVLSFIMLNTLVLFLYNRFRSTPMALMKFMGLNFSKDIVWAVFWMYLIKDNAVLAIFIASVFLFLSIPLYINVLKNIGNNQKSDKNQS